MSNKGIISSHQSTLDYTEYAKYINGRTALVAQGGGQSGIFTAGVLDAFLLSNFDPFDMFYGTSAGALNTLAYLCRQPYLAKDFILEVTTDKNFFNLFRYIKRKQGMNLDWALDKICHSPYKLDVNVGHKTLRNRKAFAAVTEVGHIRDHYIPMFTPHWYEVMKATCAIPSVYFDDVIIKGSQYIDGSVTAAIPVQEAWRQGGRNIVVIRTEMIDNNNTDVSNNQAPFDIPILSDIRWLNSSTSIIQDRWSKMVEQWKEEWEHFWLDQIDKSKQKNKYNKQLELLNGDRWYYGAGNVYRLSHLLGEKFDSGLADIFMVYYQTHALTQTFLFAPPDDCFILQIAPSEPLKSSALLSKEKDLLHDYELGIEAGYEFIKHYSIVKERPFHREKKFKSL